MDRRSGRVHARWGARFGFVPELVSSRSCETPEALVQLIMHSSCLPPVLPVYRRGAKGRIVLDGGLLDNAPASLAKVGEQTLVLLTKRFPVERIPMVRDRVCNTFLPRSRALLVTVDGHEHCFCSERCRARFLEGRGAS